ncbi:MAG: hypothetical protein KKB81_06345 [Candidatus Margulisbacteria bacterium]|nr:hypothetical protein [Candidatus Margulisiibacteriota bacterium]MBU1021476.1 hypothetical protein [Candidatus Margulisiibacteriota bacterium]MBU1728561.1 hypothetical protein [Candidatus Margulisiibacteriota bacterium]MBU1955860.1 hypothetical protein [Candidatus Margulisiibacteriota bacterium]
MAEIRLNGLVYAYENFFREDDNFSIERDKAQENVRYNNLESSDLNEDGKIPLDEYLEYLEQSHPQEYVVTAGQKILASCFFHGLFQKVQIIIDAYGIELVLSFVEEAESIEKDAGETFVGCLILTEYLIDSREDLNFIADKLLWYIKNTKLGHFLFYFQLELIIGIIKTKEDLGHKLEELLTIVNHGITNYGNDMWQFFWMDDVFDLEELINEYGLTPFVSISESVDSNYVRLTLSKFGDPQIKLLIEQYGMEPFVEFAKIAGDGTGGLLRGLINMKEQVDLFGLRIYLEIARDAKEYSGRLIGSDLPALKNYIKSDEGLIYLSTELISLDRADGSIQPFLVTYDDANLIDDDSSSFIDKYGFEALIRLARAAGDQSSNVAACFLECVRAGLVEKYGIDLFISIVEEAKSNLNLEDCGFSLFREAWPSIFHLIQLEEDFSAIGDMLISYGNEVNSKSRDRFFAGISHLRHIIHSKEDLVFVCERLLALSQEAGDNYFILVNILKSELIQSQEDLNQNAVYYYLKASEVSNDRLVLSQLTELYIKEQNYSQAFDTLKRLESFEPDVEKISKLKFKLGIALLVQNDRPQTNFDRREHAISIFVDIVERNSESHLAQCALLLKEALLFLDLIPKVITIHDSQNICVQRFENIDGLFLVFLQDELIPEVIPCKDVSVVTSGDQVEVQVLRFYGKFEVIYKKAEQTLFNNDALMRAYQILPNEFFDNFERMIFTGEEKELAGQYSLNEVSVHQSDPLNTIVHELAHHWDLSVALGMEGEDLGLGDPSKLFYDINWTPDKIEREIWGGDFDELKATWDRHDFDQDDFARDYGLCNRKEDLATMVERYVTLGSYLRQTIRSQMENGNFELAAKYLFVKYIMPFRGREYGLNNDVLGLEEVEEKIAGWLSKNSDTVNPKTVEIINKIKQKHVDIIYK